MQTRILTKNMLTKTCISRHLTFQQQQQSLTDQLLIILKQCAFTKTAEQIHTQMLINSIHKPNHLLAKLIDLKDFNYSYRFFNSMHEPNDYAFNVLIRGLSTTWHRFNLTLEYYYKMKGLCIKPNNFTYPFVFIACANLEAIEHGKLGHCMVLRCGLMSDCHVRHSLIMMYARCGEVGYARQVFDEITERDLVSWNSMISGYLKTGCPGSALELFERMKVEGFEPNEMTLVSVVSACGELGNLSLGRLVEEYVVENRMRMSSYIGSALIGMYAKCGDLVSARRIFDKMTKKDLVTWNAMITGYAQSGLSDEAISLFNIMKDEGVNANNITLSGVLSACASIGALDVGRSVDAYASERGLQHDIYVGSALIDMYAKCGTVDDAYKVFENMPFKNEVTWNAMISALAFNGRPREAISLFNRMSGENNAITPDDVTFVGVLAACVHGGMVNEGRKFFDLMTSSFSLVPKIEHYSCMVDLLSRAGLVHEAWDFIQQMPEKPDEIALGALLGACQKARNIDVSERVMKLLLEIEPRNSGNYIISSHIYANSKRWDDCAKMRLLMRQKGVTKVPGSSWIEIDAQVHEFHVGDSLHINSEDVYKLLVEEMTLEGYMVNRNPAKGNFHTLGVGYETMIDIYQKVG
ncbi:putative tetratricopeptide-like helical domain superfamily [Helianthus annuus]|uniref:Putative pentatricopeptide repeat (PPR-like) superfamily protein n=1 Tax=Helianthus annuus TaxID=4232 RepID=A0A251U101_HELAN|nr:putative tetratricopeptide-like helical domain superfamily [Helianthus annuus]KAJ0543551.1 putative tetratricopeptide-like helical domain superfamily [Helianthus annuus]KAJ0708604.1 putative tetratricopeptide-like helical domain superfamily [Helianthus annuus]KAJ0889636.1 putative tetratricopeptide-like helical domain superfamily [Helianthus annuus]KAJ0894434.1 putative tetratricopeptide-like helical domain superfamily [Helianthus annuus]